MTLPRRLFFASISLLVAKPFSYHFFTNLCFDLCCVHRHSYKKFNGKLKQKIDNNKNV